jgi:hypothetical protein
MRAFLVTTLLAAAAACSPYNPDLPDQPFLCGSGSPQCPDGYTCMSGSAGSVCVSDDGNNPGGGTDGGGNGNCADDSNLEPNDSLATAYVTPVDMGAGGFNTFNLAGLAICPAGDVDNYAFTISVDQENAVITMTYDTSGSPLQMSIKTGTGSGTAIINGAAVSGMPGVVKASPSNLPTGTYYVDVFSSGTNNYSLDIDVSGP